MGSIKNKLNEIIQVNVRGGLPPEKIHVLARGESTLRPLCVCKSFKKQDLREKW